jgi:4-hydroxy 2-oxovalerate aldolase
MYMNQRMGTDYRIAQILEAIDSNVMQFFTTPTWGYNMFYFLAASNDCHPSYVSYLTDKQTLSVKSIYDILGKLEGEKKLLFDQKYIEALYYDYQKNEVNDEKDVAALRALLKDKKLLIVGPGKTVHTQGDLIRDFVAKEAPTIISINRIPCNITPDYIFLSNAKRYVQLATRLSQEKHTIIATSNVTATTENAFSFVLNYSTLIDTKTEIIDNSLAMLLRTLNSFGVREVTLAGFDGYSPRRTNYYESELEYDFVRKKAEYLNTYMTDFLKEIGKTMQVRFLTDTRYTPTLQPV